MFTKSEGIVHIVDGDLVTRSNLARVLGTVGFTCRVHATGSDALAALGTGSSCIVAECDLPDMDGTELIAEAVAHGWDVPVLILTSHGDVEGAVRAMKAGAVDCLAKPVLGTALAERVLTCLSAESPDAQRRDRGRDATRRLSMLSRRESEVLRLIVEGKQSKTIAWELGISIKTIEVHRARIMEKTGCNSIVALGRLWESAEQVRQRAVPAPVVRVPLSLVAAQAVVS